MRERLGNHHNDEGFAFWKQCPETYSTPMSSSSTFLSHLLVATWCGNEWGCLIVVECQSSKGSYSFLTQQCIKRLYSPVSKAKSKKWQWKQLQTEGNISYTIPFLTLFLYWAFSWWVCTDCVITNCGFIYQPNLYFWHIWINIRIYYKVFISYKFHKLIVWF